MTALGALPAPLPLCEVSTRDRPSTQPGSLPRLLLLRVVLLTAFSYVTSGEEIRALPLGVYLSTGKASFSVSGHFPTVFQSGGTRSHCRQQHDVSRCPHPCRHDAFPGRCHSGGYEGCSDTASWAHLACFQWHVLRACLCAYHPSGCPSAMGPSTAFALVCF